MLSLSPSSARPLGLFFALALVAVMSACSRPAAQPSAPTAGPADSAALALAGPWQGKIDVAGAALAINVALAAQDGAWSGTIDVPVQGATGIELHDLRIAADTVYFEMLDGVRKATFDGQVQPDGSISGQFKQMGITGSFELARPEEQAAAEPLPYREEEVTFQNDEVTLAGTLTLPEGAGPFPALVLISGSGQQNRDEELAGVPGYRPFREIADHLTRQGLAVLRYDDRGVGGSGGDPSQATSADFAADAEAALAYLQGRPEIDGQQIGLLGHSEGGLIEAMIAARNPAVAFLISMAGSAVSGDKLIVKQVERLALASGVDAAEAAVRSGQQRALTDLMLAQDWTALESELGALVREQVQAMPDEVRASIPDIDVYAQQQAAAQLAAVRSPWYQFFLAYDPGEDWAQVKAPVLGLFGGNDAQVDAEQNSTALRAALEQAGNQDVTITVIPSANHLFQDSQTGGVEEYAGLEPRLMPEFLTTISNWLLTRVQRQP